MTARDPADYYRYQAEARGIRSLADVERSAAGRAHVFDRIVLPWLPSARDAHIVELACGHGAFLSWLRGRGFTRVRGIDASAEQLALARQTGAEVVESGAVEWLRAQPAESVEALVAIDFIEHIPKDALLALLAESLRVLRPGGSLILRYPNGDSPLAGLNLFNDITHVWTYTSNCLDSVARMQGFTRTEFVDESEHAIRDARWLKVPLHRLAKAILSALVRAASYHRVNSWSPLLWARLNP